MTMLQEPIYKIIRDYLQETDNSIQNILNTMHFIYEKIDTHIDECGFPEILSREFRQTLPFLFCTAFSKYKKVLHLTLFVLMLFLYVYILWLFPYIFEAIFAIYYHAEESFFNHSRPQEHNV